jgi:hypothetical protein
MVLCTRLRSNSPPGTTSAEIAGSVRSFISGGSVPVKSCSCHRNTFRKMREGLIWQDLAGIRRATDRPPRRVTAGESVSEELLNPWCHQLSGLSGKPRQRRSRRPGSVRRARVPSAFGYISSPGHVREGTRAGTCPLRSNESPTTLRACSPARGRGLLHWGVPPQASPIQDVPEQGVSHFLWPPPAPAWTRGRTSPFPYMCSNLSQIEQVVKCFGTSRGRPRGEGGS